MPVSANCLYVIPPNRDMALINGRLRLMEPWLPHGQRLPIDYFFRSLAQDQRERAIGIILSGTGSDGTQGIRAIKAEGGMVMVQSPETTEFDGMPRSAIATGLVDYALAAAQMPAQLLAYLAHSTGGSPAESPGQGILEKVFLLLRDQTGHDFSDYKPSTIERRIQRRISLHQVKNGHEYLRYLQNTPAEVDALFRDLLIGVTSFFRDPDAFQMLQEKVLPQIFAAKSPGATVRVWSVGCSTGEEAYSLAIALLECQDSLKQSFGIQVFATDIDGQAIATARAGLYPASIAADLTPDRLARYFTAESGALRVNKIVRNSIIFSEHDVIKDPPFSRLDLLVCRNLLIYLGGSLQDSLIPRFHYALSEHGFLFLGTSESVGEFSDRFAPFDGKSKIYRRKADILGMARPGLVRYQPPRQPFEPALAKFPPSHPAQIPARADRAGAFAIRNQLRRVGQCRRRYSLSARAHRPVPGTDPRRRQPEQHRQNGPAGFASRPGLGFA